MNFLDVVKAKIQVRRAVVQSNLYKTLVQLVKKMQHFKQSLNWVGRYRNTCSIIPWIEPLKNGILEIQIN